MKLCLKIISSFILFPLSGFGQSGIPSTTLYINEVSLGENEGQQYVEFIVGGYHGCTISQTSDLRMMAFDDNNGQYSQNAPGIISTGALRFANNTFWQAIPVGTYIVIYNELNRNPSIPPDDISISDGNNRLILPADSPLIEGQNSFPSSSNPDMYWGGWLAGGGQWAFIYLDAAGDTFRANHNTGNATPELFDAVSWGNAFAINQDVYSVYFSGSGSGRVFYAGFGTLDVSCLAGPASANQTPGTFNSPGNEDFIQTFNLDPSHTLDVDLVVQNEICFEACDGSIQALIESPVGDHSYVWNVPGTSNTITDLCAGEYTLTVTDEYGCTGTATAVVLPADDQDVSLYAADETCVGACNGFAEITFEGLPEAYTLLWSDGSNTTGIANLCPGDYGVSVSYAPGCVRDFVFTIAEGTGQDISFITTGPFDLGQGPIQFENATSGGGYSSDCGQCITTSGVFDPSVAGTGTFLICYTFIHQECTFTECAEFTVAGCLPLETSESVKICEGDSAWIFGNYETQQDVYSHVFTSAGGCDSTHAVTLSFYALPDVSMSFSFCEEDSVFVYGEWIDSAGIYYFEAQSSNGCLYQQKVSIAEVFCPEEVILYVPNAFTPNDDFINDVFRIEILGGEIVEGFIYNRWGEAAASITNGNPVWDGTTVSGENAPDGVYTYMIRYTRDGVVNREVSGHVTLLR